MIKAIHAPLFGWKGFYMVTKGVAELEISFDKGPISSRAKDAFFAVLAGSKGQRFGFVDGNME